jgi:hypothetical protein
MKILRYVALIFGLYIVSWTFVYAVMMNFDFKYFFDYLWASWTGPGEIPALIQVYSIGITIIFIFGLAVWRLAQKKIRSV